VEGGGGETLLLIVHSAACKKEPIRPSGQAQSDKQTKKKLRETFEDKVSREAQRRLSETKLVT